MQEKSYVVKLEPIRYDAQPAKRRHPRTSADTVAAEASAGVA
jgi:hypothetical protein